MSKRRIKPRYKTKYELTESGCRLLGIPYEAGKTATAGDIVRMKQMITLAEETRQEDMDKELPFSNLPSEQFQILSAITTLAKIHGLEQTKKFVKDMLEDEAFWSGLDEALKTVK